MPLTLKQVRFLDAYFGEANGNGRVAAAAAGYQGSPATLSVTAYETLRSPNVAKFAGGILSAEGVQQELSSVATLPNTLLGALPSKVRSLELLGKIHGILNDKLDIRLSRGEIEAALAGEAGLALPPAVDGQDPDTPS